MNEFIPQTMREKITDAELLRACDLVTEIGAFQPLQYPSQQQLQLGVLSKGKIGRIHIKEVPLSLQELNQVTGDDHEWKIFTASHWKKINASNNNYTGLILYNDSKKLLLLAHRGMQLGSVSNIANCLSMAFDRPVPIINDARRMCDLALQLLDCRFQGFTLCHTGFSMGGFLAKITASYCNDLRGAHNQAICYESPGAAHAIHKFGFKDNCANIIIYLTSPNLVNTGNLHYGQVRQISQWVNKNEYETTFRELAVEDAHVFFVNGSATHKDRIFAKAFISSHVGVFKENLSPFNAEKNFDYVYVKTWPLAENNFNYKPISNGDEKISFLEFPASFLGGKILGLGKNMTNACAEYQIQKDFDKPETPEIKSITHQIVNPTIGYSEVAFLHREINPKTSDFSKSMILEAPKIVIYSSPLDTTKSIKNANNVADISDNKENKQSTEYLFPALF